MQQRAIKKPVTVNLDREKNETARQARIEKERNNEKERQRQQEISDNMDAFYSPEKYWAKKRAKQQRMNAISQVFVGGIPYGN